MPDRRVGPGTGAPLRSNRMMTLETCSDGLPGHPLSRCVVLDFRCNHSAFNGYRWTPSDYSAIGCEACGSRWRTKAAYVDELPAPSRASPLRG